MKRLLLLFALLLIIDLAAAEANVSLETRLPDEVMLGRVYTSLVRITNLDYIRGVESFVNVTVSYNVTRQDGSVYYASSFSKLVNSFSYANTGYLFMDELGEFQFCASSGNASICMNFTVIDPMTVPCNISLGLSLDRFVYSNNERIDFKNELGGNDNDEIPFIIEYWIEDLLGGMEKKPVNTSNLNEKSFTPKTDEIDRVYVLKNKLAFLGCNNSNQNTTSLAYFVVKNQDFSEDKPESDSICKETKGKQATIVSFYTRTKKYHDEISVYANIKASQDALVLVKGGARDEWKKINGSSKLSFLVTAKPGANFYQLEVYVNDRLEDDKSLVVMLDGDEAKEALPDVAANASSNASLAQVMAIPPLPLQENKTHDALPVSMVVYESRQEKVKGWVKYFAAFLAALGLIGVIAYIRR